MHQPTIPSHLSPSSKISFHSFKFSAGKPKSIATDNPSKKMLNRRVSYLVRRIIPLKKIADEALSQCPNVKKMRSSKENWESGKLG